MHDGQFGPAPLAHGSEPMSCQQPSQPCQSLEARHRGGRRIAQGAHARTMPRTGRVLKRETHLAGSCWERSHGRLGDTMASCTAGIGRCGCSGLLIMSKDACLLISGWGTGRAAEARGGEKLGLPGRGKAEKRQGTEERPSLGPSALPPLPPFLPSSFLPSQLFLLTAKRNPSGRAYRNSPPLDAPSFQLRLPGFPSFMRYPLRVWITLSHQHQHQHHHCTTASSLQTPFDLESQSLRQIEGYRGGGDDRGEIDWAFQLDTWGLLRRDGARISGSGTAVSSHRP